VNVGVAVGVLVGVSVGVAVFVGVSVGVAVGVLVGVSVGVAVGVLVGVSVGVGGTRHWSGANSNVSTTWPPLIWILSVWSGSKAPAGSVYSNTSISPFLIPSPIVSNLMLKNGLLVVFSTLYCHPFGDT